MKRILASLGLVAMVAGVALLRPSASAPPAASPAPRAQATWLAGVAQRDATAVAAAYGLELTRTLGNLDAVELRGPAAARARLAADPRVRWVADAVAVLLLPAAWGLALVAG